MSSNHGLTHVVVDGSNIATEGRSMPSLAQLSEAVGGFMEEHPEAAITVVVDATFGHRIDKKEVPEFEAGIANNELVAPPAGAVGRGDAFVLGIADKAGASVLSNDSFQEFHGEYTWLFDEGRLIGGKPVPHVGWVWVDRVPVRGPISRKATRGSGNSGRRSSGGGRSRRRSGRSDDSQVRTGSKEASEPMPTPKSPPPGPIGSEAKAEETPSRKRGGKRAARSASDSEVTSATRSGSGATSPKSAPKGGEPVNELMPFLEFVEHHPVGTNVTGTVDSYSSHGAYLVIADTDVRGYVPLRLMETPAPRSAKSIMKIGDSVTVVVVSFAATRRSIDCALPDMAEAAIEAAAVDSDDAPEIASSDSDPAASTSTEPSNERSSMKKPAVKKPAVKKAPAKKKVAAKTTAAVKKKPAVKKAPAKKKVAAKKAPAKKKVAAKKAPAKKAPAKKKVAAKTAPATKGVDAKQSTPKKSAATKAPAKKTPAKKAPAEKKVAVKKTPVKKKVAAKKAPAKKTAAKKTAAKKSADR